MAGSFSDYTENKVLEHAVGKTAFALPTAYVALYTVAPTDAGGGTEVTGGGYVRVQTTGATWSTAASGAITNTNAVVWPQATGDWGTIVAVGLHDALTAGNLLAWATVDTAKQIQTGQTASFASGDIDITLD